jgi:hypothetical protein
VNNGSALDWQWRPDRADCVNVLAAARHRLAGHLPLRNVRRSADDLHLQRSRIRRYAQMRH